MSPYNFLPKPFQWMVSPVVLWLGGGGGGASNSSPPPPAPPPAPPAPKAATASARSVVNAMLPRKARGSTILTKGSGFGTAGTDSPTKSILGSLLTSGG